MVDVPIKYNIRHLQEAETYLLKDFLYEAIFIPPGMDPYYG